MMKKYDSYGGFQPLEVNEKKEYYSSGKYNLYRYNSAKVGIKDIIEKKQIKQIHVPFYLCPNVCSEIEKRVEKVKYYFIDEELLPIIDDLLEEDWIYLVDYFGVMDNRIDKYILGHPAQQFILDNCHSFYHQPLVGDNYLYSCKKFFGVPDGAYLITDILLDCEYDRPNGYEYGEYLLKALECGTNACYHEKKAVDGLIGKTYGKMSLLTEKLLKGIDYENVKTIRQSNFQEYNRVFRNVNKIKVERESVPYMYPLNVGKNIKNRLIEKKIYVPTLWAQCGEKQFEGSWEFDLTHNTLFLPVDQRYNKEDIRYIISIVKEMVK